MTLLEKSLLFGLFAALAALSLWMQLGVLEEQPPPVVPATERHDPDYYIENFTAFGVDETGEKKYVLEAERLVHYPDDDTALLDNPHIIEFLPGESPRHVYSDSGWMSRDGNEVLLTGNVRVIRAEDPSKGEGVMTTDKLRVQLNDKQGNATDSIR